MLAMMKAILRIRNRKLDWFRRAAERGDAYAQYRVGRMYARGQGAPQDDKQAYFWFAVAASSDSDPFHEDYAAHRDEIAGHLSPDDLAAAQLRAELWQPTLERPASSAAGEQREAFAG